MTRNMIDLIFYGSVAVFFPLSVAVIYLWSRKTWKSTKASGNYSKSRIYLLMIPGIVLMVLASIPMFYAGSLRKADSHCLALFSAPQPDFVNRLSPTAVKERRLKTMMNACPHSDYEDFASRIK